MSGAGGRVGDPRADERTRDSRQAHAFYYAVQEAVQGYLNGPISPLACRRRLIELFSTHGKDLEMYGRIEVSVGYAQRSNWLAEAVMWAMVNPHFRQSLATLPVQDKTELHRAISNAINSVTRHQRPRDDSTKRARRALKRAARHVSEGNIENALSEILHLGVLERDVVRSFGPADVTPLHGVVEMFDDLRFVAAVSADPRFVFLARAVRLYHSKSLLGWRDEFTLPRLQRIRRLVDEVNVASSSEERRATVHALIHVLGESTSEIVRLNNAGGAEREELHRCLAHVALAPSVLETVIAGTPSALHKALAQTYDHIESRRPRTDQGRYVTALNLMSLVIAHSTYYWKWQWRLDDPLMTSRGSVLSRMLSAIENSGLAPSFLARMVLTHRDGGRFADAVASQPNLLANLLRYDHEGRLRTAIAQRRLYDRFGVHADPNGPYPFISVEPVPLTHAGILEFGEHVQEISRHLLSSRFDRARSGHVLLREFAVLYHQFPALAATAGIEVNSRRVVGEDSRLGRVQLRSRTSDALADIAGWIALHPPAVRALTSRNDPVSLEIRGVLAAVCGSASVPPPREDDAARHRQRKLIETLTAAAEYVDAGGVDVVADVVSLLTDVTHGTRRSYVPLLMHSSEAIDLVERIARNSPLWRRIHTDPSLEYLSVAIRRSWAHRAFGSNFEIPPLRLETVESLVRAVHVHSGTAKGQESRWRLERLLLGNFRNIEELASTGVGREYLSRVAAWLTAVPGFPAWLSDHHSHAAMVVERSLRRASEPSDRDPNRSDPRARLLVDAMETVLLRRGSISESPSEEVVRWGEWAAEHVLSSVSPTFQLVALRGDAQAGRLAATLMHDPDFVTEMARRPESTGFFVASGEERWPSDVRRPAVRVLAEAVDAYLHAPDAEREWARTTARQQLSDVAQAIKSARSPVGNVMRTVAVIAGRCPELIEEAFDDTLREAMRRSIWENAEYDEPPLDDDRQDRLRARLTLATRILDEGHALNNRADRVVQALVGSGDETDHLALARVVREDIRVQGDVARLVGEVDVMDAMAAHPVLEPLAREVVLTRAREELGLPESDRRLVASLRELAESPRPAALAEREAMLERQAGRLAELARMAQASDHLREVEEAAGDPPRQTRVRAARARGTIQSVARQRDAAETIERDTRPRREVRSEGRSPSVDGDDGRQAGAPVRSRRSARGPRPSSDALRPDDDQPLVVRSPSSRARREPPPDEVESGDQLIRSSRRATDADEAAGSRDDEPIPSRPFLDRIRQVDEQRVPVRERDGPARTAGLE